jgi:hypothetical protein
MANTRVATPTLAGSRMATIRKKCRRSVENQPVVVELKPATSLVLNASELIWQERILNGVS